MKNLIYLLLFVFISTSAQEINYTKRLRFTNETGEKLSKDDVRKLLKDEILLDKFNAATSSRTVGNVCFILTPVLILTDMFSVMYGPGTGYPNAMSYIGVATFFIGILAKTGYQKNIREVIESHNKSLKNTSSIETDILLNGNGVGISITF